MTRQELISEIHRTANDCKDTEPNAAIVLLCLAGAIVSGLDSELAEQAAEFSRAAIIRLEAGLL